MLKEKVQKIRNHVEDHWEKYALGGVLIAGITLCIMRERHAVFQRDADGPDVATVRSLSFNFFSRQTDSGNVVTTISREGRGHPGYITRWLEEMVDYETQGLAAKEHGVYPSVMSGHIQRKIPDINGKHFERIGVINE